MAQANGEKLHQTDAEFSHIEVKRPRGLNSHQQTATLEVAKLPQTQIKASSISAISTEKNVSL
jgi:hypothetical protein